MKLFQNKLMLWLGLSLPLFAEMTPKDLTLSLFLEEAKANRKLGLLFRTKKQALEALGRDKFREFFPKVSLGYFGIKNLGENQADSRYQDVRLNVQQLLWDGGVANRQWEIAKLAEQIYLWESKKEQDGLESELRKLVFKWQALCVREAIIRRRLDEEKEHFSKLEKIWDAGALSQLEILKKKANLGDIEFQWKTLLWEKEKALSQLKDLSFWEDSEPVRLQEFFPSDLRVERFQELTDIEIETLLVDCRDAKKSRLLLEKIKLEKENSETDWIPKVHIGAYYGKNSLDGKDFSKEIAGWNFQVSMPFGGSHLNTSSLNGYQPDGSGFQRVPGFGTSPVGMGRNSFQSGNLGILDTLGGDATQNEMEARYIEAKLSLLQKEKSQIAETKNLLKKIKIQYDSILHKEIKVTNAYEEIQYAKARSKTQNQTEKNTAILPYRRQFEEAYLSLLDEILSYLEISERLTSLMGENAPVFYSWQTQKGSLQYWSKLMQIGRDND